jgi:hypothetical protein
MRTSSPPLVVIMTGFAACALIGCASSPPPCPAAPPCPAEKDPAPEEKARRTPIETDLRAASPQLDRRRLVSLEAFSADGGLAVISVDDAARGKGFEVVELGTGKTRQTLQTMALGEREARVKALKALGRDPALAWSNLLPAGAGRVYFSEDGPEFALMVDAGDGAASLARLPRHTSPEPASASAVTVAVAPGGAHVLVIYRQTTADSPSLVSDRWFALPLAFR